MTKFVSMEHTFAVLAYGDSPYIEACIKSLLDQTVQSHIVLFHSKKTDFLDALAKKYGILMVATGKTAGIGMDWTYAYNFCKTKYLTLAHQDDIYLPQYTELCLAMAQKLNQRNFLIIFTKYYELVNGKIRRWSGNLFMKNILTLFFCFKGSISSCFMKKLFLSFGNPILCPSVFYNRERIGNFQFSQNLLSNLDWEAWLRLGGQAGKFCYINTALVLHRIHSQSQTSIQTKEKVRVKEDAFMLRQFWPRPIAYVLSFFYRLGLLSNKVER